MDLPDVIYGCFYDFLPFKDRFSLCQSSKTFRNVFLNMMLRNRNFNREDLDFRTFHVEDRQIFEILLTSQSHTLPRVKNIRFQYLLLNGVGKNKSRNFRFPNEIF